MIRYQEMETSEFERLRGRIAQAAQNCSEAQMLSLADEIHDHIRRLRESRAHHTDDMGAAWLGRGKARPVLL